MAGLSPAAASLRTRLSKVQGRRDEVVGRLDSVRREIRTLEAESELLDLVAGLFRTLIDAEVTDNTQAVEKLLSEGLQTVFDDMDLSVRAETTVVRGKVSVELVTVQKQGEIVTEGDPTDLYGGSVATLQSVLLRIIVILRRGLRPVLLLDETLGAIAEHYVPNLGRFLAVLCDRLGMDILTVTHNPTLVESAHTAYRIKKADGRATFQALRRSR